MNDNSQHWLITGASGLLGHPLVTALRAGGHAVTAIRSTHPVGISGVREIALDITHGAAVTRVIADSRPDVIVHAAGLTNVDECERDPDGARKLHVDATRYVADEGARVGAKLVYISTDHLWDGTQAMVDEGVPTYPINAYAHTKLEGETIALASSGTALSIRTNFFGPGRPWRKSLSDWILERLGEGAALNMFTDAYFTPIALDHLIRLLIDCVRLDCAGLLNLAGGERLSKYDFAMALATAAGFSGASIRRASVASFGFAAPRPRDMSLDTSRAAAILGHPLPSVAESIATLFDDTSKVRNAVPIR